MKDYEHIVIWLDYFNKTLTKRMGRRLPKDKCVFDPSLKELTDAAKEAGFEMTASDEKVRFPRRAFVKSGYIALPKKDNLKKNILLTTLAQRMLKNRTRWSKR